MSAYEKFAQVYDLFMDNIDYEGWAEYVTDRLREYEITDGLVLELGCGTGTMTGLLAGKGYDMIGVDNSEEMLAEAMEKRVESGQDILYLLQDMQEFELYGTVRAVVSVCDSLNYITDRDELRHVFELVNNYLDPEGIFLFDMNTVHKYRDLLEIPRLQRTVMREVSSGITVMMRKKGSTIMNWLYFFREKTDCMRNLKKSIARRHIRRKK